jgi:hypothetical protein
MTDWHPFRESLRTTLTRTFVIAAVAATIAAAGFGRLGLWPLLFLVMLWPSFGGHWIDFFFLNYLRPRLPSSRSLQLGARLAIWFVGGILLSLGARITLSAFMAHAPERWLTWAAAGVGFVAIELVAHAGLQARGRPSFYNGRG